MLGHTAYTRTWIVVGRVSSHGACRCFTVNSEFQYFDFSTIRISQMYGGAQALDLEPQKSSMLVRGFGDRNFFIFFAAYFLA